MMNILFCLLFGHKYKEIDNRSYFPYLECTKCGKKKSNMC